MFLVGRKPPSAKVPRDYLNYYRGSEKRSKASNDQLLSWGEPFFLNGRYKDQPLIRILGPGKFWRKKSKILSIVGEAIDLVDNEELHHILDARREGDVYGRWYSEYAKDGEFGFIHYSQLEEIDQTEFESIIGTYKSRKKA